MSAVGRTIGGYRIEREIGRGSFGTVYLAKHETTGLVKAIKILLPWAAGDDALKHRLRREAKLAGHLTSEHALRIDACEQAEDGSVYLVMEYLEGREMTEVLRAEGKIAPERVVHIAAQVLEALDEAHRLGIIHRDLKPQNLFRCNRADGSDFIKVFDFGIAKVSGEGTLQETAKLTMSGGVLGTPTYMSPEQCQGETLTVTSDIYALGVVLYELATGSPPFDEENPALVLLAHCQSAPPPLPKTLADSNLGRAIFKALEKDPAARFQSAAEFYEAITGRKMVASAGGAKPSAPALPTASGARPSGPATSPAPVSVPAAASAASTTSASPSGGVSAAAPASGSSAPAKSGGGCLGSGAKALAILIGVATAVAYAARLWAS